MTGKKIKIVIMGTGIFLIFAPLVYLALMAVWFVVSGKALFHLTEIEHARIAVGFVMGILMAIATEGFQ